MKQALLSLLRSLGLFMVSVLVATVTGTLIQTQINLAALTAIGADITLNTRLTTTVADLQGFAPVYLLVCFTSLVLAFPVAAALSRFIWPGARTVLFVLAGVCGLATGYWSLDALTPPPTLIAATRGLWGFLLMLTGGALAGFLYSRLTTPKQNRQNRGQI